MLNIASTTETRRHRARYGIGEDDYLCDLLSYFSSPSLCGDLSFALTPFALSFFRASLRKRGLLVSPACVAGVQARASSGETRRWPLRFAGASSMAGAGSPA